MDKEAKFLVLTSRLDKLNSDWNNFKTKMGKTKDFPATNCNKIPYLHKCEENGNVIINFIIIHGSNLDNIVKFNKYKNASKKDNNDSNFINIINGVIKQVNQTRINTENCVVAIHWGGTNDRNKLQRYTDNLKKWLGNKKINLNFSLTYWSTEIDAEKDSYFFEQLTKKGFFSVLPKFWQLLKARAEGKEKLSQVFLYQKTIDFWIPFYYTVQSEKARKIKKNVFAGYFRTEFQKQCAKFLKKDFVKQLSGKLKQELERIGSFEGLNAWLNKISARGEKNE